MTRLILVPPRWFVRGWIVAAVASAIVMLATAVAGWQAVRASNPSEALLTVQMPARDPATRAQALRTLASLPAVAQARLVPERELRDRLRAEGVTLPPEAPALPLLIEVRVAHAAEIAEVRRAISDRLRLQADQPAAGQSASRVPVILACAAAALLLGLAAQAEFGVVRRDVATLAALGASRRQVIAHLLLAGTASLTIGALAGSAISGSAGAVAGLGVAIACVMLCGVGALIAAVGDFLRSGAFDPA